MGDGLPVLSEGTPRYTSSRWRLAGALAADVLPQAPSNLHPCGGRAPLALAAYPSQPATHRHRGPAVRLPPQERWPVTWHGKRASRMTHPGPGGGGGSGKGRGGGHAGFAISTRDAGCRRMDSNLGRASPPLSPLSNHSSSTPCFGFLFLTCRSPLLSACRDVPLMEGEASTVASRKLLLRYR